MGQYYYPVSIEKKEHVCSHDYGNGLKLMEHSYVGNNFMKVVERLISKGGRWFGDRIVWAGDYADNEVVDGVETTEKLYNICDVNIKPDEVKSRKLRFLKNLDTNEYVDLNKVPVTDEKWALQIHPLSLLTCEGNGRGGGDFRGEDPNGLIGKWARNRVVMQKTRPRSATELIFDLIE